MKTGFNNILKKTIIVMALVLLCCITGSGVKSSSTAYAASSETDYTITLKSQAAASDANAEKLHGYLNKGKTVTLKVRGSKKASKKIVSALQKKIQKTNKLGVTFMTMPAKKSGSYCLYKIKKNEVKTYRYACKFTNMLWTDAKGQAKDYNNRKYFDFGFDVMAGIEYKYGMDPNEHDGEYADEINMWNNIFSYDNFCDLSDAQKVMVLDQSNYFMGGSKSVNEDLRKALGMDQLWVFTYGYDDGIDYWWPQSYDTTEFHQCCSSHLYRMVKNRAHGVCSNFADYECCLFTQWGIKSWCVANDEHEWSVVKLTNSKGKTFYVPFDYRLISYSKDTVKERLKRAWKEYGKFGCKWRYWHKFVKSFPKYDLVTDIN